MLISLMSSNVYSQDIIKKSNNDTLIGLTLEQTKFLVKSYYESEYLDSIVNSLSKEQTYILRINQNNEFIISSKDEIVNTYFKLNKDLNNLNKKLYNKNKASNDVIIEQNKRIRRLEKVNLRNIILAILFAITTGASLVL